LVAKSPIWKPDDRFGSCVTRMSPLPSPLKSPVPTIDQAMGAFPTKLGNTPKDVVEAAEARFQRRAVRPHNAKP
jgi:hypothetical protein